MASCSINALSKCLLSSDRGAAGMYCVVFCDKNVGQAEVVPALGGYHVRLIGTMSTFGLYDNYQRLRSWRMIQNAPD
jgi:hypothetical protein